MKAWFERRVVDDAPAGPGDDPDDGRPGSAAIVGIAAGAVSGFVSAFLVRGEFMTAATFLGAVLIAGYSGWCLRGVK